MPGGELLAALLALHEDVTYVLSGSGKISEVRERVTPYDAGAFPTMEELALARQATQVKTEAREWARLRADRRKKLLTDDKADLGEIYRQLSRVDRARMLDIAEKMLVGRNRGQSALSRPSEAAAKAHFWRSRLTAEETVVLPPAVTLQPNRAMLIRLQALDAATRSGTVS